MFSYWEQKNFLRYDLIVVGAGFTGLSTAIHFQKKHPKAQILVLERGIFPAGASTKNAGFACFGSLTEILDDLWSMTQDEVIQLVERRYLGLKSIRREFGDEKLRYHHRGGFELIQADQLKAIDQLEDINKMLKGVFKKKVFSKVKEYREYGFSDQVKAIIYNKFEGELDPGAYLNELWAKANKFGIKILTGTEVDSFDGDGGIVFVKGKGDTAPVELMADRIAICTNAFTGKIWSGAEINPGRGLILLSKPLGFDTPWKGAFHYDKGYVYFREIDGRLLIGGGRNQDFEGENSSEFAVNPKIRTYLMHLAEEVIFPFREIEWDREWTGIMAFGPKKVPIIQPIGQKSAVAVRLGGMGVAIGWEVGKELSGILSAL